MRSTPLWVPLVVAVLGVNGTLVGVHLTQRQANVREDRLWQRERDKDEAAHERAVADEQRTWLRKQR